MWRAVSPAFGSDQSSVKKQVKVGEVKGEADRSSWHAALSGMRL